MLKRALVLALAASPLAAQGQPTTTYRSVVPTAVAHAPIAAPPTWSKEVSRIVQAKCQVCHMPGAVGPISLVTYADAKKAAEKIRQRVATRRMPPWHLDKTVGIQEYKNDRSLSDAEIETIVSWVEAGAPEGNPADAPPPAKFPDGSTWQFAEQFGAPDLVIKSAPYTVAARGQDKWWRPTVDAGITEERWVRAIEIKPSMPLGKKVVHHVLASLAQDEGPVPQGVASTAHQHDEAGNTRPMSAGLFMEWALGKTGEIFNGDAGKLMLPGARIRWEVHYYAIGQEVKDDQVELGVWFYPKGYKPKNRTILNMFNVAAGSELDIPPGEKTVVQNFYTLRAPARIENFQPHMHMRGKAMQMEAVYPDGRREVLSNVSNFQWNWHNNYIYADDAAPLLPKGTMLVFTAWHDNTKANPNNPDPEQWVGWGDRTVDEMAHAWVDVTYLEQADFDKLVAARKAKTTVRP
jgi:mono/diheme cytochrome c family protein